MKKKIALLPETQLGKWSVGLTAVFFMFTLLSLVTFDEGHWWDLTVGVAVPIDIAAFFIGIMAIRKSDRSLLVFLSIFIGSCLILFLLSHSLFIND